MLSQWLWANIKLGSREKRWERVSLYLQIGHSLVGKTNNYSAYSNLSLQGTPRPLKNLLPPHSSSGIPGMQGCSVTQSCLTRCNHMDCSPPGSSVHGILQARALEWVAISSSQGFSLTQGSHPSLLRLQHCRQILYQWATWEALVPQSPLQKGGGWHSRETPGYCPVLCPFQCFCLFSGYFYCHSQVVIGV